MAGTLALLTVVGVYLSVLLRGASGEVPSLCPAIDLCTEEFQERATAIGNNRNDYCRLIREKLDCYNRERSSCDADHLQFTQSKIQNTQKEMRSACGASWVKVSHWLLATSAIVVTLHRLLRH